MSIKPVAAIILAAGKGTRMKSDLHKVLHPIAGLPMLMHLLDSFASLAPAATIVVAGDRHEQLEAALIGTPTQIVLQAEQLGTAHAALQAKAALAGHDGLVLVCFGDGPFLAASTVKQLCGVVEQGAMVSVLGFRPDDPAAYGRIIADRDGRIHKMVEFKDADTGERAVNLCNSGVIVAASQDMWRLLEAVDNDNAAGEYYLPDVVTHALAGGGSAVVIETGADEVAGINSRAELAAMEAIWQSRRRQQAMAEGATLIAPETVWFAYDTVIGRDVLIEPNVFFGPRVNIADNVIIHAFSHIEGATIGEGAEIGPFARLRPGAVLEEKVKIGNFVEVKKSRLGKGAKANHLTYLGDADIGAGANVGAGTITCNYDGFLKYRTEIGAGAFIGSNSALVAPVSIGKGAIVAAGSVVTADVPADGLAIARGSQEVKPHWAVRFREVMSARKAAK